MATHFEETPVNRDTCPALWILRGTVYRTTPAGRLVRRDPEHSISPVTKRCRYCHTTKRKEAMPR